MGPKSLRKEQSHTLCDGGNSSTHFSLTMRLSTFLPSLSLLYSLSHSGLQKVAEEGGEAGADDVLRPM